MEDFLHVILTKNRILKISSVLKKKKNFLPLFLFYTSMSDSMIVSNSYACTVLHLLERNKISKSTLVITDLKCVAKAHSHVALPTFLTLLIKKIPSKRKSKMCCIKYEYECEICVSWNHSKSLCT